MASSDGERAGQAYDASSFVPAHADLTALRKAAAGCHGCPLYRDATQTVFGEGDAAARIVLLGEQPGDQEDRQGRPFVGPAGKLLARALDDAGIDPEVGYVTNAVKHFKFSMATRGKRRIHKPPNLREMTACRPWLAAELDLLDPQVVVALGATAGKALLGSSFRVTKQRGVLMPMPDLGQGGGEPGDGHRGEASGRPACGLVATIHPSAVLRADDDEREKVYQGLVSDLKVAARELT
ncbi:UdgX family uracil-DNA binding protein [Streptomyces sp. ICBB 8177]|uniref:UdgX family uracil-DNA binding protein n=1 Tax=Streptomyces sp. ICBB 8177 TaxID=563922 RepID=UPI000D679182|nr:UdgX family uracil-DNA binding protein [Streptomyces sp. ICBB 8177]PWI42844.1 uracil-DNA glycosylase [Streptomyces sp. ICBB 8177]